MQSLAIGGAKLVEGGNEVRDVAGCRAGPMGGAIEDNYFEHAQPLVSTAEFKPCELRCSTVLHRSSVTSIVERRYQRKYGVAQIIGRRSSIELPSIATALLIVSA
jgi:hypothetical protein